MTDRTNVDYAKIIARGRDAYQDLTLVEKKFAQLKEETVKALLDLKINDNDERRNLAIACKIADRVLEYLLSDINSGKHAMETLDQIKRVGKPTLLERVMP